MKRKTREHGLCRPYRAVLQGIGQPIYSSLFLLDFSHTFHPALRCDLSAGLENALRRGRPVRAPVSPTHCYTFPSDPQTFPRIFSPIKPIHETKVIQKIGRSLLTDFMAAAISSYLSACSASLAFCTSCSRSTILVVCVVLLCVSETLKSRRV